MIECAEITRAKEMIRLYDAAASGPAGSGAYGMQDGKGGIVMIDAPMLLQAHNILAKAGLHH